MASVGKQGTTVGQSVQNLISGVEELLRLASPAKDQVIALQSYMRQFQTRTDEELKEKQTGPDEEMKERFQALQIENEKLKNELSTLKSSGCDSVEKVFADLENAVRLAKEEAYRLHRLQESKGHNLRAIDKERNTLQADLEDLKNEYEKQMQQVRVLLKENRALQNRVNNKDQEEEQAKQALQKELEKVQEIQKEDLRKFEEDKDALKKHLAKQEKQLEENEEYSRHKFEALLIEKEKLLSDLSTARSRLQQDGHSTHPDRAVIGNAVDKMMIAELYKNLYDTHWRDAYEKTVKLEIISSERSNVRNILGVLEKVNTFCKYVCDGQKMDLKETFKQESSDYPDERHVLEQIGRDTTEFALGILFQVFRKLLVDGSLEQIIANSTPAFVRECIRICWLMNLHDPPIVIETKLSIGSVFDATSYEKYAHGGDRIDFVVWPALKFTDGTVVSKGIVQCYRSKYYIEPNRETKSRPC